MTRIQAGLVALAWALTMGTGYAQPGVGRMAGEHNTPAVAFEATVGYAGFLDESIIGHTVIGAAVRIPVTPRLSVGPEIVYMVGPRSDRDLIVTGNLTFDILRSQPPRPGRVTPFLVIGGGLFRHSNQFGGLDFSSNEGALTGGGGFRAWVSRRVYVASEFRLGWETHYRVTGTLGVALDR